MIQDRHQVKVPPDVHIVLGLYRNHRRIRGRTFRGLRPEPPVSIRVVLVDQRFERIAVAEQQYAAMLGRIAKRHGQGLFPVESLVAVQPAVYRPGAVGAHP